MNSAVEKYVNESMIKSKEKLDYWFGKWRVYSIDGYAFDISDINKIMTIKIRVGKGHKEVIGIIELESKFILDDNYGRTVKPEFVGIRLVKNFRTENGI